MATREKVNLVELLDSAEAFEMLDEYAGIFDDNGGEPDGDLWLAEEADLPYEYIEKMIVADVARRVTGWKVTPYTEPSNYDSYCGYSARTVPGVAYTLDEETAITIQYDEAYIEEAKGIQTGEG